MRRKLDGHGYVRVFGVGFPKHGYPEHRWIAEQVLGHPLPANADVHHANGNKTDNRRSNLVVCSRAYHGLLHSRTRALLGCGDASFRRCRFCRTWDAPENLYDGAKGNTFHNSCVAAHEREIVARRRARQMSRAA